VLQHVTDCATTEEGLKDLALSITLQENCDVKGLG